jgi:uncharacterized protein (TIGR03382 family)
MGAEREDALMQRAKRAVAIISLLAVPALFPGTAARADSPSDSRAVFVPGNATTCGDVGLGSNTQVGSERNASASDTNVSGTVKPNQGSVQPGTGDELDVAIIGNAAVNAVVIHGGSGYNKYVDPNNLPPRLQPDQHYIPPLTGGGNVPTISHWFVCYSDASTPVPAGNVGIFGITGLAAVGLAIGSWVLRRRRTVRTSGQ